MKYSGWFITDGAHVLGINRRGHEVLLKRTRRGIPSGALEFDSRSEAEMEIEFQKSYNLWPLFIHGAKVQLLSWS